MRHIDWAALQVQARPFPRTSAFRTKPERCGRARPPGARPRKPTREQIKAVAGAAVALRALRRETMRKLNYSLRDLYRTLEQPGDNRLRDAHLRLNAAVRAAYGIAEDADTLGFLLELNLALAAKEKAGEKITPPGLALPFAHRSAFVTNDCIRIERKT